MEKKNTLGIRLVDINGKQGEYIPYCYESKSILENDKMQPSGTAIMYLFQVKDMEHGIPEDGYVKLFSQSRRDGVQTDWRVLEGKVYYWTAGKPNKAAELQTLGSMSRLGK